VTASLERRQLSLNEIFWQCLDQGSPVDFKAATEYC
jgi:hypothetical protein